MEPVTDPGTGAPAAVPLARPIGYTEAPAHRPGASEILLADSSKTSAWIDIGILAIGLVAAELVIVRIMGLVVGGEVLAQDPLDRDVERMLNIAGVGMRAAAALAIIWLVLLWRGQTCHSIGLGRRHLGLNVLIGSFTPALIGCVILGINLSLLLVWPEAMRQMTENAARLMELVPRLKPHEFVILMATVGIYEEIVFRGFLMPRLRRALGSWTAAVLISTSIFTALHATEQTPVALFHICLLSLALSLITIWRRSIVPAVIAHALFNLSVVMILYVSAGDAWT